LLSPAFLSLPRRHRLYTQLSEAGKCAAEGLQKLVGLRRRLQTGCLRLRRRRRWRL